MGGEETNSGRKITYLNLNSIITHCAELTSIESPPRHAPPPRLSWSRWWPPGRPPGSRCAPLSRCLPRAIGSSEPVFPRPSCSSRARSSPPPRAARGRPTRTSSPSRAGLQIFLVYCRKYFCCCVNYTDTELQQRWRSLVMYNSWANFLSSLWNIDKNFTELRIDGILRGDNFWLLSFEHTSINTSLAEAKQDARTHEHTHPLDHLPPATV